MSLLSKIRNCIPDIFILGKRIACSFVLLRFCSTLLIIDKPDLFPESDMGFSFQELKNLKCLQSIWLNA